ncbi:hypothetical protein OG552_30130 [Streptomyces sp. NBC_01476]|uniref:hypothetical protein n=1 Tax=Streptomyces sp. NBC_01476 TaxID=2903881 RepID=UPI002E3313F9|nr:hypothetical protein [Streptomyces sp. NBC_01476]
MRRIALWITATIAIAALMFAYQLNQSGATGKGGEDDNHNQPNPTAPASPGQNTKPGDTRPGSTNDQHTGKPGENK